MVDVNSVTYAENLVIAKGSIGTASNQIVRLQISSSGYVQIEDNATLVDVVAIPADTFIHLEIQVNIDQSDGIDAVRVWANGTESANSPFDTPAQIDPSGMDRLGCATDNSTNANYWWDDILFYGDERCAN